MKRSIIVLLFIASFLQPTFSENEETRPKIGLVLGGGGALGFAHIGVLQVLEELNIPIDYIGGTSMGSIIGGMYASGMSPDEIEKNLIELNWWDVLKDKSPYRYLDYRRKIDDRRYFMNLEFGLKKRGLVFSPGMAYGQKLNNVLETFTINSIGITDFDQLNIPFRAVATDLPSGTSVVLRSGNLATAMRASMAVPGAFTPVQLDEMILVDGGILNNIPADVVKGMGADIIIAVDVGASAIEKGKASDFRSLGDVVARTYALMQRPNQELMLQQADVVIAPDLTNASASQFHQGKNIIPTGRTAALQLKDQLAEYSANDAEFSTFLAKQRKRRNHKPEIKKITVSGNTKVSETVIRKRIRMKKGTLDIQKIYADLNRIHGMGNFQTVSYRLEPSDDGLELDYRATEKFWGPSYLHIGTRLEIASESSTLWSILLNYTKTEINELGGEIKIDLEGGGHKRLAQAEWFQPLRKSGAFFIEPAVALLSEGIGVYQDGNEVADNLKEEITASLDTGLHGYEFGEARIGILGGHVWSDVHMGAIELPSVSDTLAAITGAFVLDQKNDRVFPTQGYRFSIEGLFSSEKLGASETYSTVESSLELPFTVGRHTILPRIHAGSSLGTDLPIYAQFDLGGVDRFAGYAPYQLRGNYYGVGSLGYRFRLLQLPPTLGNDVFILVRGDLGNTWTSSDEITFSSLNAGYLIGAGANTMLGTCIIAIGKAESLDPRFYFSIGDVF